MDLGNIMAMAKQLRDQVEQAQKQAAELTCTGEAGGGLVRATVNGEHQVVQLSIDPQVAQGQGQDFEFLADLVRAAINQASAKVAQELKGRLGGLAKEFGLGGT